MKPSGNCVWEGLLLMVWVVAILTIVFILLDLYDVNGVFIIQGEGQGLVSSARQPKYKHYRRTEVNDTQEVQLDQEFNYREGTNCPSSSTDNMSITYHQSYDSVYYNRTKSRLIQRRRQQHIRNICQNYYNITPLELQRNLSKTSDILDTRLRWTYFNDNFKFMLSFVHKIGSSNWQRVFQTLHRNSSGRFKAQQKDPLWTLSANEFYKTPEQIVDRLSKFTKVIFVRNPLARLLSAYKDKFINLPTSWYRKKARLIIDVERTEKFGKRQKPNVTFAEFIHFITNKKLGFLSHDNHWSTIVNRYRPCENYFDFVGHLETLEQDVDYLFNLLNIENVVKFEYSRNPTYSSSKVSLRQYFGQLSEELFQKVVMQYEDDFRVFGYHIPHNYSDI